MRAQELSYNHKVVRGDQVAWIRGELRQRPEWAGLGRRARRSTANRKLHATSLYCRQGPRQSGATCYIFESSIVGRTPTTSGSSAA